jgi:hypothetical protein
MIEKRGMRVRAIALNGFMGLVTIGALVTSSETQASNDSLGNSLYQCLQVKSNRSTETAAAWDKAKYQVTYENLSDADRLNGVSARGTVEFFVPAKREGTDWRQGDYGFPFEIKNGTLHFDNYNGILVAGYVITTGVWSCEFKNGQRILSSFETLISKDSSITEDSFHDALSNEEQELRNPGTFVQGRDYFISYTRKVKKSLPFHEAPNAAATILGIAKKDEDLQISAIAGGTPSDYAQSSDYAQVSFTRSGVTVKGYILLGAF